jgi:hypothetical protein
LILDCKWRDQQFREYKAQKVPARQTKTITTYTSILLAILSHHINMYTDQKVILHLPINQRQDLTQEMDYTEERPCLE